MTYIDGLKKVPAKHYTNTNGRSIRLVVIHDMEADELLDTAERVAKYFSTTTVKASCHVCTDTNSSVRSVDDNDVAWAAPGANSDGLQLELAGRAAQSDAQWKDGYSMGVLRLGAKVTADWCKRYSIPAVHLSNADLAAGKRGIVGHVQVSSVYKKSSHSDPGKNFPWTLFISMVKEELSGNTSKPANTPKPAKGSANVSVAALQKAVHETPDGKWGVGTDNALKTLRIGPSGKFNVKFLQKVVGATTDGKWGSKSQAAYFATVRAVETALGQTADGRWDAQTDKAFWDTRLRFYLKF